MPEPPREPRLQWAVDGPEAAPGVLRGANAAGLDLSYANLSGGNLRDGEGTADLRGTDFSGARLVGANLRGARLDGARLAGADLRRTDLRRADLRHADLRDADLRHADLREADVRDAVLTGAVLAAADLRGARLPDDLSATAVPRHLTGRPYRQPDQDEVERFVAEGLLRWSATPAGARLAELAALACRRLFALPAAEKKECWSGLVRNHDPGWSVTPGAPHTQRWHVSAAEPGLNWPRSLGNELAEMTELITLACTTVVPFLDAVAAHLSLTGGRERGIGLARGSITVRLLHYTGSGPGDRFPEHQDSGVATLHIYEDPPGLDVSEGGSWRAADLRSAPLLGAGRALGRVSTVRPLTHRVGPGERSRNAAAIFFHASTGVLRTD
ncbi:pentapeptide repeat-containing protein [Streptomyces sp. PKU-EA00015]|uniref:pentapeptide repeat-containing protein n=1 Tax=Streptomyces sp. PKU-EA00015 TaxID=2748326 RepID=UPI002811FAE4|nr:pentapeptide repeat-containing protein [Streptomyces sp. PKU-EA00015]